MSSIRQFLRNVENRPVRAMTGTKMPASIIYLADGLIATQKFEDATIQMSG